MPSFYDLMKYAKTGIASSDMTAFDKLRAQEMAGGKVKTLTGVPPLIFNSNGKPLISWSMLGNGSQTGTPTPDAPIMPQLVGEKTGNVLPNLAKSIVFRGVTYTVNVDKSITIVGKATQQVSYLILAGDGAAENSLSLYRTPVFKAGDSIIASTKSATGLAFKYTDGSYSSQEIIPGTPVTLSKDVGLVYVQVPINQNADTTVYPMICYSDNVAENYVPYGYKLPITNAGQTTPIYLGQTQTVRKIRKLVLNGQESGWLNQYASTVFELGFEDVTILGVESFSSHYVFNPIQSGITSGLTNGEYALKYFPNGMIIYIKDQGYTTVESWKSYLAQQYSAGTPVTVWYVLETPETGIVNEPLAKIGSYADVLNSEDSGVSIPTAKGANTLTVDTELQPASMTITYCG